MCPCDLSRHYVCGHHTRLIEGLLRELRGLEASEEPLTVKEYDRQRQLRGALLLEGLRADIVIQQIEIGGRGEVVV